MLVAFVAPMLSASPASASDKWCASLKDVAAKINKMDTTKTPDPAAQVKILKDVSNAMKSIEGKAPSAIKADWSKMTKGIGAVTEVSSKMMNLKASEVAKKLPALQKDMDKVTNDKSFSVSGDKVTAWAQKNCGIKLGA